ncbi:hypothetical protein VNO77_33811 [Canavalia gladiata]|uniref:Uncharacterized protein n=1 Tax=Canavalia gladiata TaxID=3824 RepID=A0AAN9Q152_CANGL
MDFYSMKRKRLQSLCKKHGIPANLKNKEMADRLSLIFKRKENEDHVSCQLGCDNAGTKNKDMSNVETIDLVSPSPGLEERTNFSAKILKASEIETNLSQEITRDDFEICGVEEDMKSGLKKEQVGNSQKGLHSALDVVNLEEFGHPLVQGEAHKLDDSICDHDAVYDVGNGRSEVETMCLDTSRGAKETNEKTNMTVEHFIDEVPSFSEVKSCDVDIHEIVLSGTATRNADTCEVRIVSSQKISLSPASERMIDFSPKRLKSLETKMLQSETILSSEIAVDFEICDVEGNMQIDVNKEQVDDNQKVGDAAPCVMAMKDDVVQVPSEEFGNHLAEAEAEKLSDKNNPPEDVSENGKGRDEDHNGCQGQNMNDVNLLHVSQEESGYPLVEEVQKSNDNIYNGGVCNLGNSGSDVDAKDTDGKTNLTMEHFADEVLNDPSSSFKCSDGTPDQFLTSYPLSEFEPSGINVHQEICEEKLKSPQKTGPIADSEECIEFSPNNLEASSVKGCQAETYFDLGTIGDMGTCNMKEIMQMEKECSQEFLQTTNKAHVIKNVDLVERSMEEHNSVQGEVTRLFDNSNVHDDAGGNGAEDGTNSYQGLNKIDFNLLLVSHKEFSSPLVEGEVHKSDDYIYVHDAFDNAGNERSDTMCLDTSIVAMDTDEKTNVTNIIDEVHSSAFNDSDGTPVQCLPTDALSEMKFGDPNIPKMVVSGIATRNVDTSQAKLVSSRKRSLSPASERMTGFSPKLRNNSETKLLQSETSFSPETARIDIAICDVEESLQIGVNKEKLYDNQEVMHATPSVMVMKVKDLVHIASEEFGNHLVEREVEKLGDKNNLVEDVCESRKGRDESVKQGDLNSAQRSNVSLLHVSLEKSGYHLVKEVQKSNYNIFHGGVYNDINSGSEVDALCLLDTSIAAKDTNGKANVTIEQFPVDVPSSSFKYSDGTPDKFLTTDLPIEVNSSDLNTHEMVASGLIADPEECIGFSPNDLKVSTIKGFQANTYFDPTTPGDVATCNMEESMQVDQMEKEYTHEVLDTALMQEYNSVPGEVSKLFDYSDVHDDVSGTEAAKDKNQHYIETDMDSMENYFPNEFQSSDDACGQNSNEKPDEYVSSMLQPSEMKSCTSNLPQISASGTFQEKLESPPKCTPIASLEESITFYPKLLESSMTKKESKIEKNLPVKHARDVLGTSDMKENIKTAKKEQVGTIISKNTFPKRQPLQDLQQN